MPDFLVACNGVDSLAIQLRELGVQLELREIRKWRIRIRERDVSEHLGVRVSSSGQDRELAQVPDHLDLLQR